MSLNFKPEKPGKAQTLQSEALRDSTFFIEDYGNPAQSSQISSIFNTSTARATGAFGQIPGFGVSSGASEDQKWHDIPDFGVGLFEGRMVALKRIYRTDIDLNRNVRLEIAKVMWKKIFFLIFRFFFFNFYQFLINLKVIGNSKKNCLSKKKNFFQLQESVNVNVISFVGMVIHSPDVFLVSELAQRGSLKDILDNDDLPLDDVFRAQMTKDILGVSWKLKKIFFW